MTPLALPLVLGLSLWVAAPSPPASPRFEPTLAHVQAAAVKRAGFDRVSMRSWVRRSRAAFALPSLGASYDHRLDEGFEVQSQAGDADELQTDLGAARVLRVGVDWRLDRLVFNPDELRAARAGIDVQEAKVRLLLDVTTLHFERIRLLLAWHGYVDASTLKDASGPRVLLEVRLAEVEGRLRALTGIEHWPRSALPVSSTSR